MKDKTDVKINNIMPCVPTRDLVVFPGMSMHFDVGRPRTIKSMKNAMDGDRFVFLCAQKDVYLEMPEKKDMFKVGTVAKVRQIVKAPDGIYRCYVEGLRKARLAEFYQYDDCYEADVRLVPNYSKDRLDEDEQLAVFRSVLDEFEEYVKVVPKMPEELYAQILGSKTPVQLFESLAFNIPLAFTDRQSLLEAPSALDKLILMITILSRETNVLSLERRIHSQVHSQIEESQREYYIREQIKALQNELGENEDGSDVNEIDEYTHRIDSLILSEEVRDKLMGEVRSSLSAKRAYLSFKISHASLSCVAVYKLINSIIADAYLRCFKTVLTFLLFNKMFLCNMELLLPSIARQLYDLHTVEKRCLNSIESICSCNKQHIT